MRKIAQVKLDYFPDLWGEHNKYFKSTTEQRFGSCDCDSTGFRNFNNSQIWLSDFLGMFLRISDGLNMWELATTIELHRWVVENQTNWKICASQRKWVHFSQN